MQTFDETLFMIFEFLFNQYTNDEKIKFTFSSHVSHHLRDLNLLIIEIDSIINQNVIQKRDKKKSVELLQINFSK